MTTDPDTAHLHSRPTLRQTLSLEQTRDGIVLFDPYRVGKAVGLAPFGWEIVRRLDGRRTLLELQTELQRLTGGREVPIESLTNLIAMLEDALLLQSQRFEAQLRGAVRPPSCIGCYSADPATLRDQLSELFTGPGGPGLPSSTGKAASPHGRLRAALLPHMDYGRGNVTYGWGFKELIEQTDASLFVIVATSHYSPHRFTLTRQNFSSPLGVVETDQAYIDSLEREYGASLFEDTLAHFPEHSIELEVVLLQYLLENRRPFRIVPLLVGSFRHCVDDRSHPTENEEIGGMVAALRRAEAACPEPVCYLISGDLAHIGPKFHDTQPAEGEMLVESRQQDEALLKQIERADPAGYFGVIAAENDRRRICGFPPTYLTLQTIRPRLGRVLHYQQYVAPDGHESVSFASAAFYE